MAINAYSNKIRNISNKQPNLISKEIRKRKTKSAEGSK